MSTDPNAHSPPTRPARVLEFEVADGEVVVPGEAWVYAWSEIGAGRAALVYVGATALHPAARGEKHLRDPDPRVGRVRAAYPAAGGDLRRPLAVRAVSVPTPGRRSVVRAGAVWLASREGLLSPRWCGEAPAVPSEPLTPEEEACVRILLGTAA